MKQNLMAILLAIAVPCTYAGFELRAVWQNAGARKRFSSLLFTILTIIFACWLIGDLLGPQELLTLFGR